MVGDAHATWLSGHAQVELAVITSRQEAGRPGVELFSNPRDHVGLFSSLHSYSG